MYLYIDISMIIEILIFIILVIVYHGLKTFETRKYSDDQIIKTLYRQAARWSTASVQDTNPLIANLHANYAAGYLWALEDLYTSDQISSAVGLDHHVVRRELQRNQDLTTRKLLQACPQYTQLTKDSSQLIATIAKEF